MQDYQAGYVKFALPKGRFLSPTANLLAEIDLGFRGYSDKTKQYRLRSARIALSGNLAYTGNVRQYGL